MTLTPENSALVLVDVQEKLFALMQDKDRLLDRLERLLKGALALNVPIVWVEQIPEKMGPTIAPLRELLGERAPICKTSFSAWGEVQFVRRILEIGHEHVLLAGIESHVCVYQTALDLLEEHHEVHVVADAVSSRTASDCRIGLRRIESGGGCLTSVEMALFELMRTSTHEAFRDVLRIVK
jgi:nicotinamidase-related amidase